MVRNQPPGIYVVYGHEVETAAIGWTGDVRVDQDHGDFGVPENVDDLLVGFNHFLGDKRAENDAFRPVCRKFAYFAPDVLLQRFVRMFGGENQLYAIAEARGMPFGLFLYFGEEFVGFVVGDYQPDYCAAAIGAFGKKRSGAIAFFDESLPAKLFERATQGHAGHPESCGKLGFAG